jgi:hypothetical protein
LSAEFFSFVHHSFTCLGEHAPRPDHACLHELGTSVNETVVATEKFAKAKELALGFIDQAWINALTHPITIFILVFALAVLFLARTGLWRGGLAKPEAASRLDAAQPATIASAQPMAQPAMALPAGRAVPIEALIAYQHAETTARTERALALSEEALRLHAASLDQLTKMNAALNRLIAQVDSASAVEESA